jgi:signal transduction histidine kinase
MLMPASVFGGSSVRRRYAVAIVLAIVSTLAIAGGIQAYIAYRNAFELTQQVQQREAKVVAVQVEAFLGNIANAMQLIARMPWGRGEMKNSARAQEFDTLLRLAPAVSDVAWRDAAGVEQVFVSRTQPTRFGPANDNQKPNLIRPVGTRATVVTTPVLLEGLDYSVVMAVADSETDAAGAAGTTLANVNLRFISSLVENLKIGATGVSYVVDQSGDVVAHPNIAVAMRQGRRLGAEFDPSKTTAGSVGSNVSFSPAGLLMRRDSIASFVAIGDTGWRVIVEQDAGEVLEPVYRSLLQSGILLAAVLVLALFAGRLLSNRIVKPIETLDAEVQRLANGDLTARATSVSTDEVGKLAGTFNKMAEQLEEYTKGLEQKIAEKTAELELANRHKSEFLANMSHELRTPLNAVIGFSDALEAQYFGPLNEKQNEYVRDISGSGQHLLSLINDILDLSKIEAGKMEFEPTTFSLEAAVGNAMTLIRERALRQNLTISAEIDPGVGMITADERKLKQILINLLTNAVKFTYPGGWVRISAVRDKNDVVVSVADNGIGIPAAEHISVFEEFKQLAATGAAKHEGTGLGLALAKRLVELHGGRIWVESDVGQGAIFRFTLPQHAGVSDAKVQ